MEKCIPGNLVGHGKTHWEVRHPIVLRRGKIRLKRTQVVQVSPMSHLCRLSRARHVNVAFIAQVSRCMHSPVGITYIAIWAIVRLLRIESLHHISRLISISVHVLTSRYRSHTAFAQFRLSTRNFPVLSPYHALHVFPLELSPVDTCFLRFP
jgi:hypothetical protein